MDRLTKSIVLYCICLRLKGGESSLASSQTIFNEMSKRHPKLAAILSANVLWDRKGEVPPGAKPYFECPVFMKHAPKNDVRTRFAPTFIEAAPKRFPDEVSSLEL